PGCGSAPGPQVGTAVLLLEQRVLEARDTGGVAAASARRRVDRVAVPGEALGEVLGTPLDGLPVLVEDLVAARVELDTVVRTGVVHVQVHGLADAVLAGADAERHVEVAQDVGGRE